MFQFPLLPRLHVLSFDMFNSRWLTLTESVSGSSPTFLVLPPPSSRRRPECPLLHPSRPTPPVRAESQLNLRRLARRADGIMRSFQKCTTIAPWSFALTEQGINSTLMYVNQLLASCSLPPPPSFQRDDRIPMSSSPYRCQRKTTDGVLPGMYVGTLIWNGAVVLSPKTGIGTCLRTQLRVFHPSFRENVENAG